MTFKNDPKNQNILIAIFLFIFLFSVYLFTFNGIPITDDEQLFISAGQNFANVGVLETPQLLGNERLQGKYVGIGAFHSIIGSLVYRIGNIVNIGGMQSFYLLSPIYTSLTAVLIFYFAIHLDFDKKIALIASLIFGLTTIAWPYSQTFHRETLAMVSLMGAWYFFELFISDKEIISRGRYLLLFGILLLVSILTKIYVLVTLPIFMLFQCKSKKLKYYFWNDKQWIKKLFTPINIIATILLVGLLFVMLGYPARLSSSFFKIALSVIREGGSRYSIFEYQKIIFAILFSPLKGLFFYSPILIYSFYSFNKKKYANQRIVLFPFYALLSFLLMQTIAYGNQWWNISWSTRFLLPVIPLLVVATLPALRNILMGNKLFWKIIVLMIVGVSFIIQLGGVLISDSEYLKFLYSQFPNINFGKFVWRSDMAPAIQHWRLLLSGIESKLAIIRLSKTTQYLTILASSTILILILLSSMGLWLAVKGKLTSSSRQYIGKGIVSIITLSFVAISLMQVYRFDPLYYGYRDDFYLSNRFLVENIDQGDIVIIDSYLSPYWYFYMNTSAVKDSWYSFPNNESKQIKYLNEILLRQKTSLNNIWIISSKGSNNNWGINDEVFELSLLNVWNWQYNQSQLGIRIHQYTVFLKP